MRPNLAGVFAAAALLGLGVRMRPEDDVLIVGADEGFDPPSSRPSRYKPPAKEYIHTAKPMSKRRARRLRGKGK